MSCIVYRCYIDEHEDLPWGWAKKSHATRSDNHQFLVPSEEQEEDEIEDEEEKEGYDSFNAEFAAFGGGGGGYEQREANVDVWYEQVDDLGG